MQPALVTAGVGVPPLDRLLGPVPDGSTLAVVNDPGVDAQPFLLQSAAAHLEQGLDVVYAVTNRPPGRVAEGMMELGFDVLASPRLRLLDAYSALLGQPSDAEFLVDEPSRPQRVAEALELAAAQCRGAVLVVDDLTTLVDHVSIESFLPQLPRLHAAMRRYRQTLAVATRWPYGALLDDLLAPFDAVVSLRAVEERVAYRQYFTVERAAWAPDRADGQPRLYAVLRPGGVVSYIPKILVTGPYDSGKSSFVHACSGRAVSANYRGTTIAMDHGQVSVHGLRADLFGTPGQSRFDPLVRHLSEQALGVVLVVDSTQPASLARARDMLLATWKEGLPAVVAANKQDLPGALAPAEVARQLGAPEGLQVLGCVARDAASARRVLDALVDRILTRSVIA